MRAPVSILVLFLSLALPASAAYTVYTDRAAWEAAVGQPTRVEDFESAPLGEIPLAGGSISIGPFTFETTDDHHGGIGILEESGNRFFQGDGHGGFDYPENEHHGDVDSQIISIDLVLDAPVHAIGFDLFDVEHLPLIPLVLHPFADAVDIDAEGFFGVVTDVPFDLFVLASRDSYYRIDNLSIPIPEPGTGGLVALGLAGVAWRARGRAR